MSDLGDAWGEFAEQRARVLFAGGDASYESLMCQFFLRFTPEQQNGRRILDVGCGVGRLALELARNGAIVDGVDLSSESINKAIQHVNVAQFIVGEVCDLPCEEIYDSAVAFMSLHCVDDLEEVFSAVFSRLVPDGDFWAVVPSPAWFIQHADQLTEVELPPENRGLQRAFQRNVFTADGSVYGAGVVYYTHGNNIHYYREAFAAGFEVDIFEDTLATPLYQGLDFAFDAWRSEVGPESLPDMNLMCFKKLQTANKIL